MWAVRVWRQCWNQCFGFCGDRWTANVFEIMMQNGIMCAVRVCRQCWNFDILALGGFLGFSWPLGAWHDFLCFPQGLHWLRLRADGLTAHIFDIMMQHWIICAVRIWRQCWNSLFWPWRWWRDRAHLWNYDAKLNHVRGQSSKAAPKFNVLVVEVIVWPRTSMELWCKWDHVWSQSFTAKLKFDILGLEGFMVVSCPLCIISYDFQWDCIDLALELMVCPRTSLILWCKIGSRER